ncbi:hypothetical protein [Pseudonocardia sp. T1-2H]|uniref:hypothetical protein n=1 Tax=Pseudonocardia sp. T1-2H TaxID=3128899 RepID=UPI003101A07E
MFYPRPRALGAGLVVALAALLTGCGNAPELPDGPRLPGAGAVRAHHHRRRAHPGADDHRRGTHHDRPA